MQNILKYSVAVDKEKTLSTGTQIANSRYAVQSQLDPILTGKIKYITDKYVDVERFRSDMYIKSSKIALDLARVLLQTLTRSL